MSLPVKEAALPLLVQLRRAVVPKALREWVYYRRLDRDLGQGASAQAVFERIYERNWWDSGESRSGPGSELAFTAPFRRGFADWLARHAGEVRTLLDAPCGDFNWMRHVPFPDGMAYVGGDIVRPLVAANEQAYGDARHRFVELDIAAGPIPSCDAWLCRDVLFHLPVEMGRAAIAQFHASDARYLLSTTFPSVRNVGDIRPGRYRDINLALPPYGLGEPIELIPDDPEPVPRRFVGVWRNPRC